MNKISKLDKKLQVNKQIINDLIKKINIQKKIEIYYMTDIRKN